MISFDTNILFAATNEHAEHHTKARAFLLSYQKQSNVLICELVLTELYLLLRTPAVMNNNPLSASEAVHLVQRFRRHPRWRLVENAPIMESVWEIAVSPEFPRRDIFDTRIALTLRHHGVSDFATANLSDFQEYGFNKIWNPLNSDT